MPVVDTLDSFNKSVQIATSLNYLLTCIKQPKHPYRCICPYWLILMFVEKTDRHKEAAVSLVLSTIMAAAVAQFLS